MVAMGAAACGTSGNGDRFLPRTIVHEDAGQAFPSGPCASWLSPGIDAAFCGTGSEVPSSNAGPGVGPSGSRSTPRLWERSSPGRSAVERLCARRSSQSGSTSATARVSTSRRSAIRARHPDDAQRPHAPASPGDARRHGMAVDPRARRRRIPGQLNPDRIQSTGQSHPPRTRVPVGDPGQHMLGDCSPAAEARKTVAETLVGLADRQGRGYHDRRPPSRKFTGRLLCTSRRLLQR